jgi:hypothetical protein
VLLALVGEGFGGTAVAGAVGFLGAVEAGVAFLGLGAGEVAEAVVLALRLVVVVVGALEGCGRGGFKLADATAGDRGTGDAGLTATAKTVHGNGHCVGGWAGAAAQLSRLRR